WERHTSESPGIELPDSGWRPVLVDVVLEAPRSAPDNVPFTIWLTGDSRPLAEGTLGHAPVRVRAIENARTGAVVPLVLQVTSAPADDVGVVSVVMTPLGRRALAPGMAATGALAGTAWWMLAATAMSWRRRIAGAAAAFLLFGIAGVLTFGF